MKILVYNYQHQYAISRKQLEKIIEILPNNYFEPIKEFHLTHTRRWEEMFEFDEENKVVHMACPVEQKSQESTSVALEELLIGLGRIKGKSKWFVPLKTQERELYSDFIKEWHPQCLAAITNNI